MIVPQVQLIREFLDNLYQEVKKDPTKAIPTIYEEIRRKISKDLDQDQKISFLQEIPSQKMFLVDCLYIIEVIENT